MAVKIEANKVYRSQNPMIGAGVIQVIGGYVTIKGSNITEYDPDTKKLLVPAFSDLIETGDTLDEGFHAMTSLPEWFGIEGSGEVWAKMCVDGRFVPSEE